MAVNNKFDSLNNALFTQLEDLSNVDKPVDVERNKAVIGIGMTLLKSAETEMQYLKLLQDTNGSTRQVQSTFIGSIAPEAVKSLPHGEA